MKTLSIRAMLLIAVFAVVAMPLSAEIISDSCGDKLSWSFNSETGVLNISGDGEMTSSPWIDNDEISQSVVSINIDFGCTSLCYKAFYKLSNLTSVSMPASITSIGSNAFYRCAKLKSVNIPESVTSIGSSAFRRTGLTSVKIPNSISTIEYNTFEQCDSLTSVTIPHSVTEIGSNAFFQCINLNSIYIEDIAAWCNIKDGEMGPDNGLCDYAHHLYLNEMEIVDLVIPSGVTTLRDHVFANLVNLASVSIPNSVTSIGADAFWGCTSLKSITIPSSVTSIGYGAFQGCTSLKSVSIPNTVTEFGGYVFTGCKGLTSPIYVSDFFVYMPSTYTGEYTIPNGIKTICSGAFYDCTALTSVNLTNSVTTIDGAFCGCQSLRNVVLPNNLERIGNSSFESCIALQSIVLPESVTSTGNNAFFYCSSLKYINIPESVTSIGWYAFSKCTSLKSIIIPKGIQNLRSDAFEYYYGNIIFRGDVPANYSSGIFSYSYSSANIESLRIYVPCQYKDNWTQKILENESDYAAEQLAQRVYGYSNEYNFNISTATLTEQNELMGTVEIVELPDCDTHMTEVKAVPETDYKFVRWSDGSTDNPYRFRMTKDINLSAEFTQTTITVTFLDWDGSVYDKKTTETGGTVEVVAPERFGYTFIGWDKPLNNLTEKLTVTAQYKRDNVDGIYYQYDKTRRTAIVDAESGAYNQFTAVRIPESFVYRNISFRVVGIANQVFENCSKITSVSLPSSLEYIDDYAFAGCTSISKIMCNAQVPPMVSTTAFDNVSRSTELQVPFSSIDDYKAHWFWGQFFVKTISAEQTELQNNNIMLTPSVTTAYVAWPEVANTEKYELQLMDADGVVSTVLFDNTGALLSDPQNMLARRVVSSEAQTTYSGLAYTMINLTPSTNYQVAVTARDKRNMMLQQFVGKFTTLNTTGIETEKSDQQIGARKILENGSICIVLPDGSRYSTLGQRK